MRHNSFDLVLVVVITCLTGGVTLAGINYPTLQLISGILFVFVLPGYAVTAALFSTRSIGYPEWINIGLGLSLIITILGGFVLNWLPWGLQKESWTILLGGLILIGTAIAWVRRSKQKSENVAISSPSIRMTLSQGVLFGVAILIVVSAVVVSRFGALNQAFPGFTQLWMLPIDSANPNAVRLGISNEESVVITYSLELKIGNNAVAEWSPIELKPGEKWETSVMLPARQSDVDKIEALLFRLDAPLTVYRRVLLWRDK